MSQFRKKPVVIKAVQFSNIHGDDPVGVWRRPEDNSPYVVTIHDQRCYLSPGDWIIPEPDGVHFYPCKPDIFAATYEPVEETYTGPVVGSPVEETTFAQRVEAEKAALDEKIEKLNAFLAGDTVTSLSPNEHLRLAEQRQAMEQYSDVLHERIRNEFK